MDASKILKADWLDILFDGRNKAYGAYQLRKTYAKRLTISLSIVVAALVLFFAGTAIFSSTKKSVSKVLVEDVKLDNVKVAAPPPAKDKPKPPPPKQVNSNPAKLDIKKVTPPKVVADNQFKEENRVHKVDETLDSKIGAINQKGLKTDLVSGPALKVEGPGGSGFGRPAAPAGNGPAAPKEDDDKPFTTVQIEAKFPGGTDAWRKYLTRNLRQDVPTENGAHAGNYTVIVSFIVDREGNISQVRAENNPGYGTAEEAVRVIQRGPKWIPAVQNGRNVVYRQRQQITFQVIDE